MCGGISRSIVSGLAAGRAANTYKRGTAATQHGLLLERVADDVEHEDVQAARVGDEEDDGDNGCARRRQRRKYCARRSHRLRGQRMTVRRPPGC